ncbi:MAG: hypothetical protein JXB45_09160, partial [Candidatus Krumholzibacteriota bacterium]|nr:hypothetical protein [Candidatus Krumholzibacteriota bacterium]
GLSQRYCHADEIDWNKSTESVNLNRTLVKIDNKNLGKIFHARLMPGDKGMIGRERSGWKKYHPYFRARFLKLDGARHTLFIPDRALPA